MRIAFAIILIALAFPLFAARNFVAASSQYGNSASFTGATNYPMTIVAFGRPATTNTTQCWVAVNAGTSDRCVIGVNSAGQANAFSVASGATDPGFLAPNVWTHIAGVYASSSSRVAWVNGVAKATNTTAVTITGIDRVLIGARVNASAVGLYMDGDLAEVAVWNVALTQAEIASLAAGFKPSRIRPQSLVFYAPLMGQASPEQNLEGTPVTLTNTPTAAAHPRVY